MRIVRTGFVTTVLVGVSRIFGFFREWLIAASFGSSDASDLVLLMLRMPILLRRALTETAISGAFVPMFNKKMACSKQDAEGFASQIFLFFVLASVLVVLALEVFMPHIVLLFAPGFVLVPGKIEKAVYFCRLTMPYLVCATASAVFGTILNSSGRFFAYAFSPAILNMGVIAGLASADTCYTAKIHGVAVGLLLSGALQVCFMRAAVWRRKLCVPQLKFHLAKGELYAFLKKFLPAGVSATSYQLQSIISLALVSAFSGAVSALSYSERLCQLLAAVFGIVFPSIMLTNLSALKARQDDTAVQHAQDSSIKMAWLFCMPCTAYMLALAYPLVNVIYQYGNFTSATTELVAYALALSAPGLPAAIIVKFLQNAFYIHRDTKNLMKLTLVVLVLNTVLNYLFMYPLGLGYFGVALGTAIAHWAHLILILRTANSLRYFLFSRKLCYWGAKVALCAILTGTAAFALYQRFAGAFLTNALPAKLAFLAGVGFFCMAIYFAIVFALRLIALRGGALTVGE